MSLTSVLDLQPIWAAIKSHIEVAFAGIDTGADHGMPAHLRRPFLVIRPLGSFNHPGLDEEPAAILLRNSPQGSGAGDPTPGAGPGWPPGPAELKKHRHFSDSHQYKEHRRPSAAVLSREERRRGAAAMAHLRATVAKNGHKYRACFHPSRRPFADASGRLRMTFLFVARSNGAIRFALAPYAPYSPSVRSAQRSTPSLARKSSV